MKKLKILLGMFLVSALQITHAEIVYPVQTMSKLECRFQDYNTLGDECKMTLPILKTADYSKYKNDYDLYRRVYTILWWSSYDYGWDVGNGWHQWVDIASAKGTPVYAITDGTVVLASEIAGRGNTVKVEHTVNGRKIYANYSHLSKIDATVWMVVKAKTKLWEIGNTGNSFGNHLHFQIDLAISGKWPRYRSNCSEKNYNKIVNSSVCFDQLNTNTIDPLLFLETAGAVVKSNVVEKPKTQKISKEWLLSREEILKKEIEEFLKYYQIKVNILGIWGNIELGKTGKFRITVIDKRTKKPFTGSFPGNMNFKYDGNRFSVFPTGILQIDDGLRDFQVTPKMAGKMNIDVYLWETFLKKVSFWVLDTKKSLKASTSTLSISKTNVIWDNNKWILYFKDSYGLNLIGVKFDGKYTLTSEDNSIKFCIKKATSLANLQYTYNIKCDEKSFAYKQEFSFEDTTSGVLVFEYKVLQLWANNFIISSAEKNITTRLLSGITPKWLDVTYPYYNDVVQLSQMWIVSGFNKWYVLQDRDLSYADWYFMLRSVLEIKLSQCSWSTCKNTYLEKLYLLSKKEDDKYKYFTRWEFLTLLGEYLSLPNYTQNDFIDFRDLWEQEKIFARDILKNKTWKDYFGQTKYFQPKKVITRWEWIYLLNQILK